VSELPITKLPLLAACDEPAREAIAERLEGLDLPAGTLLFAAGDPADAAYFIVSGRIRVRAGSAAGDVELGAGDLLGALSIVLEGAREVSAETLSHARVLRLSRGEFRRLVDVEPSAACALLEQLLRDTAHALRSELARREAS